MENEKELTIKEIEDSWDTLSDFEKRYSLETRELSKEFLEANWEDMNWEQRCLTGRQENITFEFLEDKWERLDATQRVSLFLFCTVPLEFAQKVWKKLDKNVKSAALTIQAYPSTFIESCWKTLTEKERDTYIEHGTTLSPNFVAEHWTQFTKEQKNKLKFRKLVAGVTADRCPIFLTDNDPEVRAGAVEHINRLIAEEDK